MPLSPLAAYYLNLVTSEYKTAPNFMAFLAALLGPVDDLNVCLSNMNAAFDVDLAVGAQLDVVGRLVGATRQLPYAPGGGQIINFAENAAGTGYVAGDVLTIVQGGASGGQLEMVLFGAVLVASLIAPGINYVTATGLATTGGTGTGKTVDIVATTILDNVLGDDDYRVLLKAKIAQNQWDGTIESLYPIWQTLFPGGQIILQDNQNMTANVLLIGAFSDILVSMIQNGLIVPRPEGVLYNYLFPVLPMFGFDRDDAYVAGWGVGHWA